MERLTTLVLDPDEPGRLMNIYLDDCLYWKSTSKAPRRIVYYHRNGNVYSGVSLLEDFEESRDVYAMGADRLDNSNFINLTYVKEYDKQTGTVYFNDNRVPAANVARINGSVVENYLRRKALSGVETKLGVARKKTQKGWNVETE